MKLFYGIFMSHEYPRIWLYDASFMVSFYEFIGFSYTFHEYFLGILSSGGLIDHFII